MALFVAASLFGHAALILLAIGVPLPHFESPISVEVLPSHRSIQKVGEREHRDAPRAKSTPPRKKGSGKNVSRAAGKSSDEKKEPRPEPGPPETTNLSRYAPGDAHLIVLLRTRRLRQSPYRSAVDVLLRALPDYQTLILANHISLFDDLDALLIATSDPRNVYATVLAARHHVGAKMETLAARPMPAGDPRVFRVLSDERIALLPREEVPDLDEAADASAGGWLALLDRFEGREGADAPTLTVTVSEVNTLVRLGNGLPTPRSIFLAARADHALRLRVELVFAAPEEATSFASAWPSLLERWRSMTRLFGLTSAFDDLMLQVHGHTLEILGSVPEGPLRLGLSYAKTLLPSSPRAPVSTLPSPSPSPPPAVAPLPPSPPPPVPEDAAISDGSSGSAAHD
jgi:hypothetical protein